MPPLWSSKPLFKWLQQLLMFCCCLVTKLCLWDPVNCSPPGSSVHGISQPRVLEWVAISKIQGILLTQELNLCFLHGRWFVYHLIHWGSIYRPAQDLALKDLAQILPLPLTSSLEQGSCLLCKMGWQLCLPDDSYLKFSRCSTWPIKFTACSWLQCGLAKSQW